MHGPQDDVVRHQVECGHLLLCGERRQQTAIHRVNVNRVLALKGKAEFRRCWMPRNVQIDQNSRLEYLDLCMGQIHDCISKCYKENNWNLVSIHVSHQCIHLTVYCFTFR